MRIHRRHVALCIQLVVFFLEVVEGGETHALAGAHVLEALSSLPVAISAEVAPIAVDKSAAAVSGDVLTETVGKTGICCEAIV